MPLRIAIATRCLGRPFAESLRAAAKTGARGVQFDGCEELPPGELTDTGRRQLLNSLEKLGLSVASLAFLAHRSFCDEEQLDARVAACKRVMEFAWQLGTRVVAARIGKVPADRKSKAYQILFDVLSDLARYGNQIGATLAITPTHDAPQALVELLTAVKAGPLGIDFDPAVFIMSGHNPADALRLLHSSVIHFTARDADRDVDAGGREVAVGRGEVDWRELMILLDEIGYSGRTTVIRSQGDDRAGDVVRAVQYLKNVFSA